MNPNLFSFGGAGFPGPGFTTDVGLFLFMDAAIKSFLLLMATLVAACLMRKRSAATVHRLWTLGFAGCLVIPVIALVAPTWTLPIFPTSLLTAETNSDEVAETETSYYDRAVGLTMPLGSPAAQELVALPRDQRVAAAADRDSNESTGLPPSITSRPSPTGAPAASGFLWTVACFAGWIGGVLICLLRTAWHQLALARLLGRCSSINHEEWRSAAVDVSRCLGLNRPVQLLKLDDARSPMVGGILRTIVVLPGDADDWVPARRRLVLLHELGHAKRHDVLTQTIAGLVCALHWFNPVCWFGLSQMRTLRELACDDLVIANGQRPADYAEVLLDVARSYRHRNLTMAVGMARRANVENRILAVLDKARSHVSVSRKAARTFLVSAAALVVLIGSMRLQSQADPPTVPPVSDGETSNEVAERLQVEPPDSTSAADEGTFEREEELAGPPGTVVSTDPAAGEESHSENTGIELVLQSDPEEGLSEPDDESSLGSIERRVRAVYEATRPAIVRIVWGDKRLPPYSGVIVTADGYVVTMSKPSRAIREGNPPTFYLPGGRRVAGTALGWSEEWKIGLMKIAEKGPWPHVRLGKTPDIKVGEPCVVLGYPRRVGNDFGQQPALRLGSVTRSAGRRWFTSSSIVTDFGSSVFDLEGRLMGVTTKIPTHSDPLHSSVELFKTHWEDLVAGKNLDRVRFLPPANEAAVPRGSNDAKRRPAADKDRLAAVIARAKPATVRIGLKGPKKARWSGVIVTADGYVITCAHHLQFPGTQLTIRLPDGRDVSGTILGTNLASDIGLVKITDKGLWPHVEMGNSTIMRSGDPCIFMGYPSRRDDRQPLVRTGPIVESEDYPWSSLILTSDFGFHGGDSGGGLFDLNGRVVAVIQGQLGGVGKEYRHARIELFRQQWDSLAAGKRLDAIVSEPLGEVTAAFRRIVKGLPPFVVDVLGDDKQRALGTIVGSDGRILTKASELYGMLSCRFADGRILPATVIKVSHEHDLAVLKVDARDLPEADWSQAESIGVGTLIAALAVGKPALVGVVSSAARPIPGEGGWLGVRLRDSDRGLEVYDDKLAGEFDVPIRKGDVIVHVEGHRTADLKSFNELTRPKVGDPVAYAGDPVRVGVQRGDETLEFRFPLPPSATLIPYSRPEYESLRCSGFATAFDTDIPLAPKMCGGPVVDKSGRVAGIAIASRRMPGTEIGRVHVIPAAVASKFVAD